MKLLSFENYELKVEPEVLLIGPIRKLYRKDSTRNKEYFMKQLSYIYFMVDPRSTYSYIDDKEEKSRIIIEQEGLDADTCKFKPSADLVEAMDWYAKHTETTSSLMLQSTLVAANKIRNFLMDVDLNAEVDGKAKYDISKITTAMKNVMDIIPKLKELEKKVLQDTEDKTRTGIRQKAMFEDFNPIYNDDE